MPKPKPLAWDYQEITLLAETRIRSLMKGKMTQKRDWAFGTFLFWSSLTAGHQEAGDSARLEELTNGLGADHA